MEESASEIKTPLCKTLFSPTQFNSLKMSILDPKKTNQFSHVVTTFMKGSERCISDPKLKSLSVL